MDLFRFRRGTSPLLVSVPHAGTHIPPELRVRLTAQALALPDTDWHVDRLYDFLDDLGASVLIATHSRYVIDLNRPPDNANLYPGQDTTGLVPVDTVARADIYRSGEVPGEGEVNTRRASYWQPYHEHLEREVRRIRAEHGYTLLWDAHSIPSRVPRFFSGRLPDLNVGTNSSASCAPSMEAAVFAAARRAPSYSSVLNGRFKGGYITRHYGRPAERIHAIQLELSQRTYMDEPPPFEFRDDLAAQIRPVIRTLLDAYLKAATASA
jgi:N-formylglutamate deformylase